MKPIMHDKNFFSGSGICFDKIEAMPIVECPKCNYKIPVRKEFTDYEFLYNEMKKEMLHYKNKVTIYFEREREEVAYIVDLYKSKLNYIKSVHDNRKENFKFLSDKIDNLHNNLSKVRKERDNLLSLMDISIDGFFNS